MDDIFYGFLIAGAVIAFYTLIAALYFLPTLLAYRKNCVNRLPIMIVNIFGGWIIPEGLFFFMEYSLNILRLATSVEILLPFRKKYLILLVAIEVDV